MTLTAFIGLCDRFELKARIRPAPGKLAVSLYVSGVPLINATAVADAFVAGGTVLDDRAVEFGPDERTGTLTGLLDGIPLYIVIYRGPRGAVVEV